MNSREQRAVVRLGNRLYADAIAAAQAAQADGTSGHLATAAYNQLAGVWETPWDNASLIDEKMDVLPNISRGIGTLSWLIRWEPKPSVGCRRIFRYTLGHP